MQITQMQDMVGKTIKRIELVDTYVIGVTFEDGSYCGIYASLSWDTAEIELYEDGDFDDNDLRVLGVISEREYEKRCRERTEKRKKDAEKREYQRYLKVEEDYKSLRKKIWSKMNNYCPICKKSIKDMSDSDWYWHLVHLIYC